MMDRETWIQRIASSLWTLGDANFQERSWVRAEGDEVSSFDEALCALSDFDLEGFAARCAHWEFPEDLSSKLLDYWSDLKDYAHRLGPYPSPEVVLGDSRWRELRDRAKTLSETLGYHRHTLEL
jgi:hypothetical protein